MRRAAFAAALLLAACSPVAEAPPGVRRVAGGEDAHDFSVSFDASRAAWIEGRWPNRTELALLELGSGRLTRRRLNGYTLLDASLASDTAFVTAHKLGFSETPYAAPKPDTLIEADAREGVIRSTRPFAAGPPPGRLVPGGPAIGPRRDGALAHLYAPDGGVWVVTAAPEGDGFLVQGYAPAGAPLGAADAPGPVESLLPERDALYLLTRSSESLSGAGKGPRELRKVDLASGRPVWRTAWAPRESRLLRRGPDGRLFASVDDGARAALWAFEDSEKAAAHAAESAWNPNAGRGKALRTAILFIGRILPGLALAALVLLFRR